MQNTKPRNHPDFKMSPSNMFVSSHLIIYTITINCAAQWTEPLKYPLYNMYEVVAFNSRERNMLYSIHKHYTHMYFLNGISNEAGIPIYVAVTSCCIKKFEDHLFHYGIQFSLLPNDSTLDKKLKETNYTEVKFRSWINMNKWINKALEKYSDIFSKKCIGMTSQLRRLNVLKVSQRAKNIAVFIMGGEDAREWISIEIVLQLIQEVLQNGSPLNSLLKYYDFYFLPLLNADGYEYSRTVNRFWAKNRRPIFLHTQKSCLEDEKATGANLDMNWYTPHSEEFADEDECDALNPGKTPLSEEETKALAKFLNSIAESLMLFMNIKGFANIITIPYGYKNNEPDNYSLMLEILKAAHKSVHTHFNVTYDYGNTAKLLWSCADWVKKELNVPLVYTAYMMHEGHVMPLYSDARILTAHLALLLKEILTISKQIYSPLFNSYDGNIQFSPIMFLITVIIYLC